MELRMWHTSGVAFHAILLGEYLPEDPPEINFVTLAVARDLLAVALCDDRHRIWVISLDRYFEACPRGLDWDLLKERHRCTEGVGVMGQTSKLYQAAEGDLEAVSVADAVASVPGSAAGGATGCDGFSPGLPGCYQRDLPYLPSSLPYRHLFTWRSIWHRLLPCSEGHLRSSPSWQKAGDHFLDNLDPRGQNHVHVLLFAQSNSAGAEDSDRMVGMAAGSSSSFSRDPGGLSQDGGVTRCMPFAWHERILQTRDEWLEVDRPRRDTQSLSGREQSPKMPVMPKHVLTGFSVPAQHRLGDDDLNYNLCAAVHRHAQREYQNRLPPWLVSISLPHRAKRFNPPQLGSVGVDKEGQAVPNSGSELVTEETENGDAKSSGSSVEELHQQASLEALRQELQP
eukprot:s4218_g4.t3